ncbi:MAG: hypothetical protein H6618_09705 [Deltaproteobacteria bacterium]|nr:hypothetical protein [Deltaproteobacteria bacterium]
MTGYVRKHGELTFRTDGHLLCLFFRPTMLSGNKTGNTQPYTKSIQLPFLIVVSRNNQ